VTKKSSGKADKAPQGEAASAFGQRLRSWRTDRDLTLRHISETSGISIAYLSDLERGKLINPTLDTLTALAGALAVSLNELLGLENEETPTPKLSAPLEEFRQSDAFRDAVAAEATRWRAEEEDIEQGWIDSLSAIRVARRSPKTASDFQFIFEAARRVLE
jgi:XRE family transcriptional regulator of biofilm formation